VKRKRGARKQRLPPCSEARKMLAGFRSRQPWHMRAVLRMAAFRGARSKICFRPEQSAAGGGVAEGGARDGRQRGGRAAWLVSSCASQRWARA
jgi:hypothetical protein